jgi:hypothetical protein
MTTRRSFIKSLAVLPAAFSFRPVRAAADPSRLALIIGNSSYRDAPLVNPASDARAVGALLTQAGFSVDSRLDATRADMMAAIERFGAAVKRSETRLVVFYYAGHGAQLDWRNYLLPVDAVVQKQDDLKQRCVDLGLLLGQFSAAKDKTFVVILDACRNNPFGSAYRPEQKGLSQFDAPVGSLLAYATAPGNVASDGEGQNGLYTENLVRELGRRDTRIEDALKRVRLNVRLASHGEQIPWETTSLESDVFIFSEGRKKLSESELEQLVEADVTEWARIKSSKRIDDWVGYLRSFPNGRFAEIAQMRLARLLAEKVGIRSACFPSLADVDRDCGLADARHPGRRTGADTDRALGQSLLCRPLSAGSHFHGRRSGDFHTNGHPDRHRGTHLQPARNAGGLRTGPGRIQQWQHDYRPDGQLAQERTRRIRFPGAIHTRRVSDRQEMDRRVPPLQERQGKQRLL